MSSVRTPRGAPIATAPTGAGATVEGATPATLRAKSAELTPNLRAQTAWALADALERIALGSGVPDLARIAALLAARREGTVSPASLRDALLTLADAVGGPEVFGDQSSVAREIATLPAAVLQRACAAANSAELRPLARRSAPGRPSLNARRAHALSVALAADPEAWRRVLTVLGPSVPLTAPALLVLQKTTGATTARALEGALGSLDVAELPALRQQLHAAQAYAGLLEACSSDPSEAGPALPVVATPAASMGSATPPVAARLDADRALVELARAVRPALESTHEASRLIAALEHADDERVSTTALAVLLRLAAPQAGRGESATTWLQRVVAGYRGEGGAQRAARDVIALIGGAPEVLSGVSDLVRRELPELDALGRARHAGRASMNARLDDGVLDIPAATLRAMRQHLEGAHPDEGMGLLATDGLGLIFVPLAAQRSTHEAVRYEAIPESMLLVGERLARLGLELVAYCHSHADASPVFSSEDLANMRPVVAAQPRMRTVIDSVRRSSRGRFTHQLASFSSGPDGQVRGEDIVHVC